MFARECFYDALLRLDDGHKAGDGHRFTVCHQLLDGLDVVMAGRGSAPLPVLDRAFRHTDGSTQLRLCHAQLPTCLFYVHNASLLTDAITRHTERMMSLLISCGWNDGLMLTSLKCSASLPAMTVLMTRRSSTKPMT